MIHDLGAMQSPWDSVKGSLTPPLPQPWLDIQAGLKDSAKVGEAICQEETKLKKVYDSAIKSQSISSSLLLEHIRKLESDIKDLESMFGLEHKLSQPSTPELPLERKLALSSTPEEPSLQRTLSFSDKIKSAFGIETSSVNFEPPSMERRQSLGEKIKSAFGIETSTTSSVSSSVSFEPPAMERRQSIGEKIKSAFGIETSTSVSFEQPKVERRQSFGDKIKSAFRTDSPTTQDKAIIGKAALSLDDRCQTYKKTAKSKRGNSVQRFRMNDDYRKGICLRHL